MLQNGLIILFLLGGCFFFMVGTVGLVRLPEAFSRMHATTKCDTLGAGLILVAMMIHTGIQIITIKLFVILIFIWITNPTAAHIISKAAYNTHQDIPRSHKIIKKG